MGDNKKHIDEDLNLTVPNKLSSDLKVLFNSDTSVPPEIDRDIIDKAHQHFIHRQKRLRLFRWSASAAAAVLILMFMLFFTREHRPSSLPSGIIVVAAAVLILMFMLFFTREHRPSSLPSGIIVVQADIDQSGSVDILDAFKLARHIESTDQPNKKWDINSDGLTNNQDVDAIAFTAVRLDKGVL
ncbi:MAG: dockerin type I domain-containing protein [Planctomycetota bacterium]|jgi:hypothetical protein